MNKTDSSTTFNTPINDKIEVDNLSDTSSTQQNQYLYDFFKGSLNDIKTLETNLEKINIELQDLRNELEKTKDFYNSISKLSNITRIVICILILLPILQGLICIVLMYFFSLDENLSGLANFFVGTIGLSTFGEMVYIPKKLNEINDKIKKLELKFKEANS